MAISCGRQTNLNDHTTSRSEAIRNGEPLRLAILTTHPIQYYAPVFRELDSRAGMTVGVFYGWNGPCQGEIDRGFGQRVEWDVPLLEGYTHQFLENRAADPGTHRYNGIDCPNAIKSIEAWSPDAILVYGWRYRSHLAVLRHFHRRRVPILFRGDSTLLDETSRLKSLLRRSMLRWIYRHVDAALYVGTNNRAYFEKHGVDESRLFFAPHAVDNDRFEHATSAESDASAWRAQLGIGERQTAILFVGKLSFKKAPDLLTQAFAQLADTQTHLIFAGSGPLEPALRANAPTHVHFIGFQNQQAMPTVYRLGDLVALPSRGPGETWGLALNEAMACGRAVLASDRVGAAVDLITPNENGWIVRSHDQPSLLAALRDAVALGRARLRAYGDHSSQHIKQWSIPIQVDGIAQAAHEIVRRDAR
ncbi:MAG: glycosyltransferase family 4 protein [Planctomycetota bacterium]